MRLSNLLMGTLNFITLALSIPIIIIGVWLATNQDSECMHFLQQPTIVIGAIILLLSVIGFLGSCYRIAWMLWIYLFCMLALICVLLFFTVFTFIVSNPGASHVVANTIKFHEYRMEDFSGWLQKKVRNPHNWRKIKGCLKDSNVCGGMYKYNNATDLVQATLSPFESGCCKPPILCKFSMENATLWEKDDYEGGPIDPDCRKWSNNQEELCYECNSCRAGLLANIKRDWHKVAIVNLVVLLFLILVFSIGCSAFHNARKNGYYNRHWLC